MARKNFATSIDEEISKEFKITCIKNNEPMNTVLERFMDAYSKGKFKLELRYENNQYEEK